MPSTVAENNPERRRPEQRRKDQQAELEARESKEEDARPYRS
jgi:hypothetical protein